MCLCGSSKAVTHRLPLDVELGVSGCCPVVPRNHIALEENSSAERPNFMAFSTERRSCVLRTLMMSFFSTVFSPFLMRTIFVGRCYIFAWIYVQKGFRGLLGNSETGNLAGAVTVSDVADRDLPNHWSSVWEFGIPHAAPLKGLKNDK